MRSQVATRPNVSAWDPSAYMHGKHADPVHGMHADPMHGMHADPMHGMHADPKKRAGVPVNVVGGGVGGVGT